MGGAEFYLGDVLAQELADFGQIGDARDNIEALAAAEMFAQQGFANDDGIERRDVGAHREAVQGRRGDERKFAHAGKRQLQGAGNGRGSEGQHMDIGAEFLEALLVLHTEVLLLIDDKKAEVTELDVAGEQRVGADDDVDVASLEAGFHRVDFLAAHQTRGLGQAQRQALEALGEGGVVLAGQKGCGHDDGHLLAIHGGDEGGAERHLGFAEAHVAADQAVHGAAFLQIVQHGLDGGQLVFGFLIGEAGAEFIEGAIGRRQNIAGLEFARARQS